MDIVLITVALSTHHFRRKAATIIAPEIPRLFELKFASVMEVSIVTGCLARPKVILDKDLCKQKQTERKCKLLSMWLQGCDYL